MSVPDLDHFPLLLLAPVGYPKIILDLPKTQSYKRESSSHTLERTDLVTNV